MRTKKERDSNSRGTDCGGERVMTMSILGVCRLNKDFDSNYNTILEVCTRDAAVKFDQFKTVAQFPLPWEAMGKDRWECERM